MKFQRKDKNTKQLLYIVQIVAGVLLLYMGITKLFWLWNILSFPIGILLLVFGIRNFKSSKKQIYSIHFQGNTIILFLLNGEQIKFDNNQLNYSLLAKKYYQPLRCIEILEKGKSNIFRGNSLGKLPIENWGTDLPKIAKIFIEKEIARKKWKFSLSFGEVLLLFSVLIGGTELIAESYVGEINSNLSESVGDIGSAVIDEEGKTKSNEK